MSADSSTIETVDVAIVGGGVAGLYCGWRLRCDAQTPDCQPEKVTIFECDARVGGRVASFTAPGMPHVVGELGAMQFLSTQPMVSALAINRLRLPVQGSPLDKPIDRLTPDNISYLRGKHLRNRQVSEGVDLPYNLSWSERGRDPTMLLRDSLELLLPGVTSLHGDDLDAFLKAASYDGQPLYAWGFWNLLSRALSSEACDLIRDSLGYDFFLSNFNADAMIREVQVLFPGVTYYTITSGYDQLPLTMAEQFVDQGGDLRTGWQLLSFRPFTSKGGEAEFELTFRVVPTAARPAAPHLPTRGPLAPGGVDPGPVPLDETVTVYARTLVLAMPRRAIELLGREWPTPSPRPDDAPHKWSPERLLTLVTPVPIVKVFLCYRSPWWRRVTTEGGMAFSDLPVQQCTYWGVEGEQPFGLANCSNALTMAALADSLNASFWEGLLGAPPPPTSDSDAGRGPGPADGAQPADLVGYGSANWYANYVPVESMIARDTHRQLLEIHGLRDAPPPYAAAVVDWSQDPYGGACHYWQHHVDPWEAGREALQPVAGHRLFICGEAYSNEQGWVEGALATAEKVLGHVDFPYRLQRPGWLPGEGSSRAVGERK